MNRLGYVGIVIILLLTICVGVGWWLLSGWLTEEESDNIEVIVPGQEDVIWWILSPKGDKIVYRSRIEQSSIIYLLLIGSDQRYQLQEDDGCSLWLDNTKLLCFTDNWTAKGILATDDFTRHTLKEVKEAEVDLKTRLQEAGTIYRYPKDDRRGRLELNAIFLLDSDYKENPDKNYKVITDDVDLALQGYDYFTIPVGEYVGVRKGNLVYSPDEAYYYPVDSQKYNPQFLTIYDTTTDDKVAEYTTDLTFIDAKGWAPDSSGVYFKEERGGVLGRFPFESGQGIMKLKVPE